jgi:steroid delta-isomerase-like uncharacterized protein
MQKQAIQVIEKYYDAFNKGLMEDFFSLLTEEVIHDINHGKQEQGKERFRAFMKKMHHHYKEKAVELIVFANQEGTRGAAEFFIEGTYLATDVSLPPARGQKYRLRCGAFFDLRQGKISRVTNYYNLNEWLSQIT